MSIFDTVYEVEHNGRLWRLHWKNRYDPITLALAGTAVGTGISVAGTLRQGRQAQELAEERAAIDIQNAEAVREASVEEAAIRRERGQRILATQRSQAAAGGIRINVGVPLVIATQTRADITKDIGFSLERGRVEAGALRGRAAIEIATGKAIRRKSAFDAISRGLTGFGSIAFMGTEAGLFGGRQTTTLASTATRTGSTSNVFSPFAFSRNF